MSDFKEKYINLFTDYGFKRLFGEELNKNLLLNFCLGEIYKLISTSYFMNRRCVYTTVTMIRLSLLLSILCVSLRSFSQELLFNHLTIEDGLSSNFDATSFVDHYGYLWVGTSDGLDRYDGADVRSFTSYFPEGNKHVLSICEDRNGHLLIGTYSGLYIWDRRSIVFDHFTFQNDDANEIPIHKLHYCGDDSVYFISDRTLWFLNVSTHQLEALTFHSARAVADFIVEENVLFSVGKDGLFVYDRLSNKAVCLSKLKLDDLSYLNVFCMVKYGDDLYLSSTEHGLWRYSISANELYIVPEFNQFKVRCLEVLNNQMIVGTMVSGLKLYNLNTCSIQSFVANSNDPTSLSSNAIQTLSIDHDNTLWIGTHTGGINYFSLSPQVFKTYKPSANFEFVNRSVRSLYFDSTHKFIGTRDGLFLIDSLCNMHRVKQIPKSLGGQVIIAFYKHQDELLVSTLNGGVGVYSFLSKRLEPWMDNYFKGQNVYSMLADSSHHLWLATHEGLVQIVNSDSIIHYNSSNSELHGNNCIYAIEFDVNNRLWVASTDGVSVYNITNGSLAKVKDIEIGTDYRSNYLYLDASNVMWICTRKFGVYQYDMDLNLVKNISEVDGLCDNTVLSILELSDGFFYLGTQRGLSRYDNNTGDCSNFISTLGLPSPSFCLGASLLDANNTIWMGNEKGLVSFKHQDLLMLQPSSNLHVTDILVDGVSIAVRPLNNSVVPVEDIRQLVLPVEHTSLAFHFANLTYPTNENFKYCVILEGRDSTWTYINNENQALYSQLDPGDYVFKIGLSQNGKNIIEGSIRSVYLTVLSPLYTNTGFILGFILLLFLLAYASYYFFKVKKEVIVSVSTEPEKVKYESSKLGADASKAILYKVQSYFEESQVFLNEDLRIGEVSATLNIPARDISQAINENLSLRFTSFTNEYRINEVKKRMKHPDYSKFTLQAIAKLCGFKSKTSFNLAFKKVTGLTPTEYLDKI